MKEKKRFLKRMLAVFCAATLTLGSGITGNLQKVEAEGNAVLADTKMEFGKTSDTYLQLEKPLTSTPNGIEATVGLEEEETSWTLYSANDLNAKYSGTLGTTTDGEAEGLPAGSEYTQLTFDTEKFATGTVFLNPTYNISIPDKYTVADMELQVWIRNAGDTVIEWNKGNIELTSEGKPDWGEIEFALNASNKITLNPGWNLVKIPLTDFKPNSNADRPVFNLQGANFMRWYGTVPFNGQRLCFTDMKLVAVEKEEQSEWMLWKGGSTEWLGWGSTYVTNGIPAGSPIATDVTTSEDVVGSGMGYVQFPYTTTNFAVRSKLSIDVSQYTRDQLAIGMWIYTDTTTLCRAADIYISNGEVGLSSAERDGKCLLLKLDRPAANTGWNYVEFPLSDFTDAADFDIEKPIGGFAIWQMRGTNNTDEIDNNKVFKIGDIKLVVHEENQKEQREVGTLAEAAGFNFIKYNGSDLSSTCLPTTDYNLAGANGIDITSGIEYTKFTIPAHNGASTITENQFQFRPTICTPEGVQGYEMNELAVEFYLYSNQERTIPVHSSMRLMSGAKGNTERFTWVNGGYPSTKLNEGWNKITLRLDTPGVASNAGADASFNVYDLKEFRWDIGNSSQGTQAITTDWTIAITDLKLVAVDDAAMNKAAVLVSDVIDTTALENLYMVFSNTNAKENNISEAYAFFVAEEGKPALLYGNKQFTLNKKLVKGQETTIKVVRDDTAGNFSFYENGNLVGKSTTAVTAALEAPVTKHCIGADVTGGQLMYGSIKNLTVYGDTACEIQLGSWALDGNINWVLNTITDKTESKNNAIYIFSGTEEAKRAPIVVAYTNATGGKGPQDPRMNGYVFAGWFSEITCADGKALTKDENVTGTAYAKYVDANILSVSAQVSGNAYETGNTDPVALRFITTVDSEAYAMVGFHIETSAKKGDMGSNKVYKELYATGVSKENKGEPLEYSPNGQDDETGKYYFSPQSILFKTYTMNNIKQNQLDGEFQVTPYWITLDGTRVDGGPTRTFSVNIVVNGTQGSGE